MLCPLDQIDDVKTMLHPARIELQDFLDISIARTFKSWPSFGSEIMDLRTAFEFMPMSLRPSFADANVAMM